MLPSLRNELSLHSGPAEVDGSPTWTIRDPVRNRYFRLSWPTFEVLSRWGIGSLAGIAEAVNQETTLNLTADDVAGIAQFLIANQLTRPNSLQDSQRLAARAEAERHSWLHWLVHHYLFFRIPLARPDRMLGRVLPLVRWMGSRWFRGVTVAALLVGLILIGRQWDVFVATLVDTFSLPGLIGYAIALSVVKVVHELAHAFTAKNFGCRVPTMGIAFLVMWPMLYTDVNEAWMLPERHKRLFVGAAGIVAELSVAAWATLAWVFLPGGLLREAAFVLAALTWVSSLLINLSPFMRFDGYFLAMDALEIPNLHRRSFAMAKWWLREKLFGLGALQPEPMAPGKRRAMVVFAFAVWIYRLVLFLGIAVLVYHFFIKVVGVVLFAIEIGWFVIFPVVNEIKAWWGLRKAIVTGRRVWLTVAVLTGLILVLLLPWQDRIFAPAVLKPAHVAELFLPFPARFETGLVARGEKVISGQVLMRFVAPDIEARKALLAARIVGRRAALDAAMLNPTLRDRAGVLGEDLQKARAELAVLDAESARLDLTAPMDGRVFDLLPDLESGEWLSSEQKLGAVYDDRRSVAVAYVAEDDLGRISDGAKATFIPRSLDFGTFSGRLERIDPSPVKALSDGMLSTIHGGDIPSRVSGQQIVPEGAFTRVTIAIEGTPPNVEAMGSVSIAATRSSLFERLIRSVMIVVIREWAT